MFTADQARAAPSEAKFQRHLEANERVIRGVASIADAAEREHYLSRGVLIYDGDDKERMTAEMRRRGFTVFPGHITSGLRVWW